MIFSIYHTMCMVWLGLTVVMPLVDYIYRCLKVNLHIRFPKLYPDNVSKGSWQDTLLLNTLIGSLLSLPLLANFQRTNKGLLTCMLLGSVVWLLITSFTINDGYKYWRGAIVNQEYTLPEKWMTLRAIDLKLFRIKYYFKLHSKDACTYLTYTFMYYILVLQWYKQKLPIICIEAERWLYGGGSYNKSQDHEVDEKDFDRGRVNELQQSLEDLLGAMYELDRGLSIYLTSNQVNTIAFLSFIGDKDIDLMDSFFNIKGYEMFRDTIMVLNTMTDEVIQQNKTIKDLKDKTEENKHNVKVDKSLAELKARANFKVEIRNIGED